MPYNLKLVPTSAKKLRHLLFDLNCIPLTTHTIRHQSWHTHTHTYTHLRCPMRLSGARWTNKISFFLARKKQASCQRRKREARCLSWERGQKSPGASLITNKILYKLSGTGKDLLKGKSQGIKEFQQQ